MFTCTFIIVALASSIGRDYLVLSASILTGSYMEYG